MHDQPLQATDYKSLKKGKIRLGSLKNIQQVLYLDHHVYPLSMRETPQVLYWKPQATTQVLLEQLNQL